MGEVYRARDSRLNRTVAIKILPAHLAARPELRERLEREAIAISGLNHPQICALYDIGHEDGVDFLVMEHLEGETLADRLAHGRSGWTRSFVSPSRSRVRWPALMPKESSIGPQARQHHVDEIRSKASGLRSRETWGTDAVSTDGALSRQR